MSSRIIVLLLAFIIGTYMFLLGVVVGWELLAILALAAGILSVVFFAYARAVIMMPVSLFIFILGWMLATVV